MGFVREWPLVVDAKFSMPGAPRGASASACKPATPVTSNQRFPRERRLTSAKGFSTVLKQAQFRKRLGPLRFMCRKNQMHIPRLGLIVGKRVVAKAAERNRVKRVIRNHFRCHQDQVCGYDVVVQVMQDVGSVRLRELLTKAFGLLEAELLSVSNATGSDTVDER